MPDRQINSVRTKIDKIRRALEADKRNWGGQYHDGRGLRYLPPEQYLKIQDYAGAIKYFNWFKKNFPDDIGFPDFLFAWTITLFYNGKLENARRMAYRTFFSNTYLFDKFFGRSIIPVDKWEGSNLETPYYADQLPYSSNDSRLSDFAEWLRPLNDSDEFRQISRYFIDLNRRLKNLQPGAERSEIVRRIYLIEKNL